MKVDLNPIELAVIQLKDDHKTTWSDKPDSYWFARLVQEIGELGIALVDEHEYPPGLELEQIAAICLNWLEKHARAGIY